MCISMCLLLARYFIQPLCSAIDSVLVQCLPEYVNSNQYAFILLLVSLSLFLCVCLCVCVFLYLFVWVRHFQCKQKHLNNNHVVFFYNKVHCVIFVQFWRKFTLWIFDGVMHFRITNALKHPITRLKVYQNHIECKQQPSFTRLLYDPSIDIAENSTLSPLLFFVSSRRRHLHAQHFNNDNNSDLKRTKPTAATNTKENKFDL